MAAPPTTVNEDFIRGLWKENPVFVQLLGLCPALAVTNSAINAVAMSGATAFVLCGSSVLVSSLRSVIPKQVRITTFIIIIATFVTTVDFVLAAILPDAHKQLGAFLSLIVVNCLILGRQEAFASRNRLRFALADAAGMAVGFTLTLMLIGGIREVLGAGALGGVSLFGPNFEPWVIMLLPPGGFLTVGVVLVVFAWLENRIRERRAATTAEVSA